MDYAPIKGIPGFAEAAMEFTFGRARPEAYLAAIATPGGTGGYPACFLQLCRGRQQDLDTRLVLGCLRCDRRGIRAAGGDLFSFYR
jgi:hypothetical protein